MKTLAILLVPCLMLLAAAGPTLAEEEKKSDTPALDHKMKDIQGKIVDLSKYKGKAVLIVNTASECGYTEQYEGLQKLHDKYAEKGLAILGFPSNQFGGQEPGSDEEIARFCEENYGVEFDMFSKIKVNGEEAAPLYKYLTSEKTPVSDQGEIKWNFEKFLIGRDGKVVARFRSKTKPTSEQMVEAVEKELREG